MQTVFSQRLLAGLRNHGEEEVRGEDTFHDPDDRVDPDDSGPRLSVTLKESSVDEIYASPAGKTEQTSDRCPDTPEQSNAPQSPPGATVGAEASAPPNLLDPAVLRTRVAAFMLYEPPEPPLRRAETLVQRAHREMIEDCGSWVGE